MKLDYEKMCKCADHDMLHIDDETWRHMIDSHNALDGLDPSKLAGLIDYCTTKLLPCLPHYVDPHNPNIHAPGCPYCGLSKALAALKGEPE